MDNAHAHPPPRPSPPALLPSRLQHNRELDADFESASPATRQQRLLRARNAKFPAKKLSISSISARFSQLIKTNEPTQTQSPAPRNQENTVYRPHKDYGVPSHPNTSLGILEEITNSISVRNKTQPKKLIPIFQDTPERGLLEDSPYASPVPYRDESSLVNSPAPFDNIQDSFRDMGLREISGNARKVSPLESPPFVASVRASRPRKSTQKSRFNSEEYIEHIERELELVKDAVYSPNSNRSWKEKLKAAKAENERLRKEIVDVRMAFEAEVQKTVEHMTSTEADLVRKIRALKEDLEQKESIIQNLECQYDEKRLDQGTIDTLKATIEKLESEKLSLEQANDSMSRRNEVLTQLLALSPTKSQYAFELSSPVRGRNNPRPKSMIPRMPSSPGTKFLSRPQSVVASPSISASAYFSPKRALGSMSTPPQRRTEDILAEDASIRSPRRSRTDSTSRRSTLTFHASMSPSSLDLQQTSSPSVDQPGPKQNPKRRTRRFLHGSTQLKPLLLPTLTGENGALTSASLVSPDRTQQREFSEESIDPTTTFLSKSPEQYEPELESYPFGHDSDALLTQTSRQLAYQSLEGVLDGHDISDGNNCIHNTDVSANWDSHSRVLPPGNMDVSVDDVWSSHRQNPMDQWMYTPGLDMVDDDFDMTILPTTIDKAAEDDSGEHTGLDLPPSPSPTSLCYADIPEPLFSPISHQKTSRHLVTPKTKRRVDQNPMRLVAFAATDSPNSRKRRKLSSCSDDLGTWTGITSDRNPTLLSPSPSNDAADAVVATPPQSRNSSLCGLSLKSPSRAKSPLEILQQRSVGGRPLATVTIQTIYGSLSRYTAVIREIRCDPLALARRVIANAWHTNWSVMGKLSWWVLGLFLGPSRQAVEGNAWDWDDYDGESIADRYCRRSSRDLDGQSLHLLASAHSPERHVRFDEQHRAYRTRGFRSSARPALKKKTGWGESVLLWGKFSVAIMLAVGGAIVKGPAEMLRDTDHRSVANRPAYRSRDTAPGTNDDTSAARRHFDERAFDRDLKTSDRRADSPRRLKNRSTSPPPSARGILRSGQSSFMPQISSSPAFQFGHNEMFQFSSPCRDHDWGDVGTEDGDTLKPVQLKRGALENLFSSPLRGALDPDGGQEYDPESAGLVFLGPLRDIVITADSDNTGQDEVVENG